MSICLYNLFSVEKLQQTDTNQMFTTRQSMLFTDLTNRKSLAETHCEKRWDDSIWMTDIDPDLPLTHILLSIQQFILQTKGYWKIQNLTAGNFFILSKREMKSPKMVKSTFRQTT